MRSIAGLVAGGCAATLIACAASPKPQAGSPEAAPAAMDPVPPAPGTFGTSRHHEQIATLDRQIETELAQLGLSPPAPAACAAIPGGCAQAAPIPLSVTPVADDPTCKPGASETCQDACTLSESICSNSDKICELAGELGGGDADANETCERSKRSCTSSRERCCGCV